MAFNPVTIAIKQAASKLRAAKAAALADPNLHPLRRKLYEASPAEAEAQDRADAQQRAFEQAQQPPRTRKRKQTLAGVAKDVAKAGILVDRYEVKPDGTIGVVVGKPGEAKPEDDGWRDVVLQ